MSLQSDFAAIARHGGRATLVTVVSGPNPGAKLLLHADGTSAGTIGSAGLDAAARAAAEGPLWSGHASRCRIDDVELFIDVVTPPRRLLLFGALELAAALAQLAATLGWHAYVIDPRGRFAARDRFPEARDVIVAWPQDAIDRIGGLDPATAVAALSHDPKIDDAALLLALRSNAFYVGAMGSRRAHADRLERLRQHDIAEAALARIAAPIGFDLGAHGAQETALSVLAEIIAAANGRDGGRLASGTGPIHERP